jgi:hypothetical protein
MSPPSGMRPNGGRGPTKSLMRRSSRRCSTTRSRIRRFRWRPSRSNSAETSSGLSLKSPTTSRSRGRLGNRRRVPACSKSHAAKLIKLAYKNTNVRAVAISPPVDWSKRRRRDYIEFCTAVVDKGARLKKQFPDLKDEELDFVM